MNLLDVDQFIRDGFLKIEGAFDAALASKCRDDLWTVLEEENAGLNRNSKSTWPEADDRFPPGHPEQVNTLRVNSISSDSIYSALNSPGLLEAYDVLFGTDRWNSPKTIGSFPVNFPCIQSGDEYGWHIDGCVLVGDEYLISYDSRCRALLRLVLFSNTPENGSPTLLKVGSHLDVAKVLSTANNVPQSSHDIFHSLEDFNKYEIACATGNAGDVYLCHPFLIHAAQRNLHDQPRFMGQPGLHPVAPLSYDGPIELISPVERAVSLGISQ